MIIDDETACKLGAEAAKEAEDEIIKLCREHGLTEKKTIKAVLYALRAKKDGEPDHSIRLNAAKLSIGLLRMAEPKKIEITGKNGNPISIDHTPALRDTVSKIIEDLGNSVFGRRAEGRDDSPGVGAS